MRPALKHRGLAALSLLCALAFVYRPVFSGRLLAGRDLFRIFIPSATYLRQCLRRGELPLWLPNASLGQPFAAALHTQAYHPLQLFSVLVAGPVAGITLRQLLDVSVAVLGTFWLCRQLGCSRAAACFAGAAFGFSPLYTNVDLATNLIGAAAWTGAILGAARRLSRAPGLRNAALLGCAAALSLLCGSPETFLWQACVVACVGVRWGNAGRARGLLRAGLGMAWGVLMAGIILVPGAEFALHSSRSLSRGFLAWSVSPAQLLSAFWPLSDLPLSDYWGADQYFFNNLFLGSLVGALALLALRQPRRSLPWAVAALVLGGLSLGQHLAPAHWLLSHPPLGAFRYPAKYFMGFAYCTCVLAALGLDQLAALARRVAPSGRRVLWTGLAGLAVFLPGLLLLQSAVFRRGTQLGFSWAVLAATLALGVLFGVPSGPGRGRRVRWAVGGLALLESLIYNLCFPVVGWASFQALSRPSALASHLARPFDGRLSVDPMPVDDPAHPDTLTSNLAYVESSRDGLVPLRFIEEGLPAVEGYGAPEIERLDTLLKKAPLPVYNLLGVTHFVRNGPAPFPGLQRLGTVPGVASLYQSDTALPRAFVVHRAAVLPDDEVLTRLRDPGEPFRTTAFLAPGAAPFIGSDCRGSTARYLAPRAGRLELAVQACAEGVLVVTDSFYPGWRAELDGRPVAIERVDYLARGVRVPGGDHQVVMRYQPWTFLLGLLLSLGALLAALWALLYRSAGAGNRHRG